SDAAMGLEACEPSRPGSRSKGLASPSPAQLFDSHAGKRCRCSCHPGTSRSCGYFHYSAVHARFAGARKKGLLRPSSPRASAPDDRPAVEYVRSGSGASSPCSCCRHHLCTMPETGLCPKQVVVRVALEATSRSMCTAPHRAKGCWHLRFV